MERTRSTGFLLAPGGGKYIRIGFESRNILEMAVDPRIRRGSPCYAGMSSNYGIVLSDEVGPNDHVSKKLLRQKYFVTLTCKLRKPTSK
jgi:hypothetical protein